MGEVIIAPIITRLNVPVERVVKAALEKDLDHVVVLGWDKDGDFYFASSYASGPEVVWLLEMAKKKLLEIEL